MTKPFDIKTDVTLECPRPPDLPPEVRLIEIIEQTWWDDPGFDYRCDNCDNGLQAEWDFCPFCGLHQCEESSGICLAGLAANKACRPDDTLKRCTICGFVVDTQYAVEKPTMHLRPTKDSGCV